MDVGTRYELSSIMEHMGMVLATVILERLDPFVDQILKLTLLTYKHNYLLIRGNPSFGRRFMTRQALFMGPTKQ